ncbi:DNA polymerase III subunit delta' [Campylobacter sp. RM10532]|uniref:DNA polymerase III subunit delta' n=1 Tax=Campylobacter molothri TaxID=1032242 RepID=UPI001DA69908|nr:DNA polymerase III subunit delta' [Campylobacter sp. RM10537]MBZ7944708.1 DNA polymerase III subunit delta' [Campylobacter sp. RM10532]MBZ7945956.1 DNA polymerase III subunit delta' [Campylobacter sp. RM10536]MBZ7949446.1 DNA polymerase III subunit delta' [Campylobacter sp. RM10534]MBZ7952347.1 DNA polymerase III subunit delta' [Campylobacter sp. RM9939]MBZ7955165.1 DNA polymerase III subunit delta' [Campylobacter sp. RM17709]MBZ7956783.1 DNA polymerase III subunit delta' [Campylobacter sp
MFTSKILISEDFERIKEEMIEKYGYKHLRFIPKIPASDFLLDDARLVEKESYIAEVDEKIIILMAHNFRIEAQNFLLKLLEEPPKNIKFLIVVPSKNLLLPTIKSRLICEKRNTKKTKNHLNLDLNKMDLKILFEFLQENENLDKNELMEKIILLTEQMVKIKDFNEKELEFFYESYELAKLNSKSSLILATLLLNFYTKK